MPPPTLTTILANLPTMTLGSGQSISIFTPTQVNAIWTTFVAQFATGTTSTNLNRAWASLLFLLANHGHADKIDYPYSVDVTDAQGNINTSSTTTFNQMVSAFRAAVPDYTNQRMGRTFATETCGILKQLPEMTDWGRQRYMPSAFKRVAFPAAIFAKGVTDAEAQAVSAASRVAIADERAQLGSVITNHYSVAAAKQAIPPPAAQLSITL